MRTLGRTDYLVDATVDDRADGIDYSRSVIGETSGSTVIELNGVVIGNRWHQLSPLTELRAT